MPLNPKHIPRLILAFTSIVFSRALFWLFNDPEGPNLLIVTVAALMLYGVSLAMYAYVFSVKWQGTSKVLSVIFIQVLLVAGLYFLLR